MTIESNIEISQPPSVVYEFMMDEENLPLWLTNFVRMETISGEPGEVGSISKHFYNERGRVLEFTEEITEIRENELMAAKYESEDFDMHIANFLKPAGEASTRLTIRSEYLFKSFWMKLFAPFARNTMQKRMQENLERLKDAIEELTEIE